jgi:hypothetical protein
MKKGSPEEYNAPETGLREPAQKPHSGETHERQPPYRIRCTQEKHQILRQAGRRKDRRGRQTASYPRRAGVGLLKFADLGFHRAAPRLLALLFLDEVGDMSLRTQAKVLRVIEEQRFEPVAERLNGVLRNEANFKGNWFRFSGLGLRFGRGFGFEFLQFLAGEDAGT